MLSCVRDHSMNLSLLYESDDDYVDPENILAEPPPEMEGLDVDVEDVEMHLNLDWVDWVQQDQVQQDRLLWDQVVM